MGYNAGGDGIVTLKEGVNKETVKNLLLEGFDECEEYEGSNNTLWLCHYNDRYKNS